MLELYMENRSWREGGTANQLCSFSTRNLMKSREITRRTDKAGFIHSIPSPPPLEQKINKNWTRSKIKEEKK
jgi:hypothetical protein